MQRTSESGLPLDRVGVESELTDFRPAKRPGRPGEYPCRGGKYLRLDVGRAGYPAREPDRRDNDLIGSHPFRSAMRTDAGSAWVCDALCAVRDEY